MRCEIQRWRKYHIVTTPSMLHLSPRKWWDIRQRNYSGKIGRRRTRTRVPELQIWKKQRLRITFFKAWKLPQSTTLSFQLLSGPLWLAKRDVCRALYNFKTLYRIDHQNLTGSEEEWIHYRATLRCLTDVARTWTLSHSIRRHNPRRLHPVIRSPKRRRVTRELE